MPTTSVSAHASHCIHQMTMCEVQLRQVTRCLPTRSNIHGHQTAISMQQTVLPCELAAVMWPLIQAESAGRRHQYAAAATKSGCQGSTAPAQLRPQPAPLQMGEMPRHPCPCRQSCASASWRPLPAHHLCQLVQYLMIFIDKRCLTLDTVQHMHLWPA